MPAKCRGSGRAPTRWSLTNTRYVPVPGFSLLRNIVSWKLCNILSHIISCEKKPVFFHCLLSDAYIDSTPCLVYDFYPVRELITSLCKLNSQLTKVYRRPSPHLNRWIPSSKCIVFNFYSSYRVPLLCQQHRSCCFKYSAFRSVRPCRFYMQTSHHLVYC